MKRLSRYGVVDPYTLEELSRKYKMADPSGRIRVLRLFCCQQNRRGSELPDLPFEIALMAVEDPNVEVRQWIARNARFLDYGDSAVSTTDWKFELDSDGWPKATERELTRRLRNDPDVFVRACLHENSEIVSSNWITAFYSATHLERLALMRNEQAAVSFNAPVIEKLFDPDDKTLKIDSAERTELILAYVSNRAAQRYSHLAEDHHHYLYGLPLLDEFSLVDREHDWEAACGHLHKLWMLALKWPAPVPVFVFRYIGAEDRARAETYQQCSDWILRPLILESSIGRLHPHTIALGSKSGDTTVWGSLGTLVRNSSLTPAQLKSLESCIHDLPDNEETQSGKKTLLWDLQRRMVKEERRHVVTSWSPPDNTVRYLIIATFVLLGFAIIGTGVIFGRVTWLLLALLCALALNACVMWQSSAAVRNALQMLRRERR